MPSSGSTTKPPVTIFAPLVELVGWLTSTTLHVLIGLAAGTLVARLVRHHHLRWTWAAVTLVPFLLARSAFSDWGLTLDTAVVCATVQGRHWHREDLMAGADLAEIAAARRGPLAAMRILTSALHEHLGRAPIAALRQERMSIGRTEDHEHVSIPFGATDGGRHTLIVGATGSGKTVTETWIATRAIEAGLGAVVLDPKGDLRMREQLVEAAHLSGRRFLEWTPRGPSVYNPFGHGAASEIADKALAGERFTEPHYQRQAQRYLGHAVRALHGVGEVVSLRALVELLDPSSLEVFSRGLTEQQSRATYEYLDSLTTRARADLSGVRDRLAIMVESDVAPWLDPATPGAQTFDLLDAVRQRAVVYFALQADAWPLLAHMLGVAGIRQAARKSSHLLLPYAHAVHLGHAGRVFPLRRSAWPPPDRHEGADLAVACLGYCHRGSGRPLHRRFASCSGSNLALLRTFGGAGLPAGRNRFFYAGSERRWSSWFLPDCVGVGTVQASGSGH